MTAEQIDIWDFIYTGVCKRCGKMGKLGMVGLREMTVIESGPPPRELLEQGEVGQALRPTGKGFCMACSAIVLKEEQNRSKQ